MPTARHSATVPAPASELWPRLIDFPSWPRWMRVPWADRSVTLEPPGAPELGSIVAFKGRMRYRLFARIDDLEPERHLALEVARSEYPSDRALLLRARYTIDLEPLEDGKTRVTATHEVEGKGLPGRLYMGTVFRLLMGGNVRNIVRSFEIAARERS